MATVTVSAPRKVRLANTHNVLSRARPLDGTATVGDVAIMTAEGKWAIADGTGIPQGIFIGFSDGRVDGLEGDDAEVLMWGIVAGFEVDPGVVVYDAGDGTIKDVLGTGDVAIGIGLNDGLLYVRPALA